MSNEDAINKIDFGPLTEIYKLKVDSALNQEGLADVSRDFNSRCDRIYGLIEDLPADIRKPIDARYRVYKCEIRDHLGARRMRLAGSPLSKLERELSGV